MLNEAGKRVCTMVFAVVMTAVFLTQNSQAQIEPRELAVEVTATVQTAPAQVRLAWPFDANATSYTISRKLPSALAWTSLANLGGSAGDYTDVDVTSGSAYEYRVAKTSSLGVSAFGYILAGINAPLVEDRGKLILIVDNTHATELAPELARLQQDLAGDGWTVIRHDVSPTASVASVKSLIKADYDADRTNVKAALLFGHVPVPRSGDINPDGHPNHIGAWAADTYYADMDGVWTDSSVNDTSAERADNFNVPGDGRFDQGEIPSDLELAVGRVDLSNMTCYANKIPSRSEVDLLRQYLNKDHNFRNGLLVVPRRGLVADNFGYTYDESFSAPAYSGFAAMFGGTNTTTLDYGTYFPTLTSQGYLFSYACGGGAYYTCNGIGGSDDFVLNDIQTVFTMFFGSYFGDWDNESNFLRASLGSGSALATSWSGRPLYFYHRMALGETVGQSVRLSQNNGVGGVYEPHYEGSRYVNTGLLGDPTLRLHPVLPPTSVTATAGAGLVLSWTASGDAAIQGYHVYRSTNAAGPFTRLNNSLVGNVTFTDPAPVANGIYMIRAVKLESTSSGTYLNPSQGIFYTNTFQISPTPTSTNSSRFVKSDSATHGNWKGVYGSEGNWVIGAPAASLPSYGTVTTTSPRWVWAAQTTSPIAPYLPGQTIARIAACWYSATQVGFDFTMNDAQRHRVSIYFLDWTGSGRQQRVDLIDRDTGAILDSRAVSGFANGIYLTWDIAGNVSVRLTPSNINAVASAIFFDAVPAPAPATAAQFITADSATRGNWKGIYGSEGSWVAGAPTSLPNYATITTSSPQWIWVAQTANPIAPYLPGQTPARIAACWYSVTQVGFDFAFNDAQLHRVSIYFLDWTGSGRQQRADVIDRDTGAILDSRTLSSFANGVYLTWNITGNVSVRLTPSSVNAVASAIFFDPIPSGVH